MGSAISNRFVPSSASPGPRDFSVFARPPRLSATYYNGVQREATTDPSTLLQHSYRDLLSAVAIPTFTDSVPTRDQLPARPSDSSHCRSCGIEAS